MKKALLALGLLAMASLAIAAARGSGTWTTGLLNLYQPATREEPGWLTDSTMSINWDLGVIASSMTGILNGTLGAQTTMYILNQPTLQAGASFYVHQASATSASFGNTAISSAVISAGSIGPNVNVANASLDGSSVTKQGNTFNGANHLIQADANGVVRGADIGPGATDYVDLVSTQTKNGGLIMTGSVRASSATIDTELGVAVNTKVTSSGLTINSVQVIRDTGLGEIQIGGIDGGNTLGIFNNSIRRIDVQTTSISIGGVDGAVSISTRGEISISSGGFTAGLGHAAVNVANAALDVTSVTKLGPSIDLGAEVTGTLPVASVNGALDTTASTQTKTGGLRTIGMITADILRVTNVQGSAELRAADIGSSGQQFNIGDISGNSWIRGTASGNIQLLMSTTTTGRALCLSASSRQIVVCTSAVGADGTCTCP